MKIRATALKELLDRERWQLRHLKGSELVADGFTKGLTGAAWQKYCQDLGVRLEPREAIQEQQDVVETKVKLAKAAIGVGGLLVGYGYGQHNARGKYLQAVGAMVMSVGVLTLQQVNQWPGSSTRSLTTTSSTSGEKVDDQETTSRTSSLAWVLGTSSTACEDEQPRLCVLRERSRSRDDRDEQPRPRRGTRDEDSQEPTEPAESPATNISNQATGSGGDGGAASASAAAERTRRNEEMADLNSAVNVATYERDTDVVATPPEHVLTDAERRRQSDERLGRNLSNRVRIEMEEGEEELSVLSDHNVEIDREALERRRDQAVDEAIRRMSAPADRGDERRAGEEEQPDEDMEGDPRDEIEALLESERLPEENARRRAAQNDAAVREALRRLGVPLRPMEEVIGARESAQNLGEEGHHGVPGEEGHHGVPGEEVPQAVPGDEEQSGNLNYIEEILAAEREEMEESLNSLAQRGMISEGMAQQVAATALQVSRGRRCYEATLEEVDLDPTEGVARMDVVVRGTIGTGSHISYHVTGSARAAVSRCIHGSPEAVPTGPRREPEEQAEEEAWEEGEWEEGEWEEGGYEEEAREEDQPVDEGGEGSSGISRSEAQQAARYACLQFAEYQMFRRRALQKRDLYVKSMAKLGVEITPENEANNELIQAQSLEQAQAAEQARAAEQAQAAEREQRQAKERKQEEAEWDAMMNDGIETEGSWDPEKSSETEADRRSRLRKEAILAHARMQVFKNYYNRNKKLYQKRKEELGEEIVSKEKVVVENDEQQGNALQVDMDEVCDYSPTTQGSVHGDEPVGPVGPKPPSEPEESEGRRGGKGRHRTWASVTPERMREEDFVALRHPRAPWPIFVDKEKDKGTTEKPVIPGEEKTEEKEKMDTTETEEEKKEATEEENEWSKVPGAYSQNFVLLEDAEARREEMDEEDSRDFTEEEWQQLPPWRQERIREMWKRKGKGKRKGPKYPHEPRGPFEPDDGPGGPASGSGDGIALRMMRRVDQEEEDEWGFVEDDRQIAQGSVAATMMAKAKSSAGPMLRAPRTEGELPEDLREPRKEKIPEDLGGHRRGEGEIPADRRERHGQRGELPEERRGHRRREGDQLPGLPEGGEVPEQQEGEPQGRPAGEVIQQPIVWDGQVWDGQRWIGARPTPSLQRMSTSSGLPSDSEERTTPMFGSSTSESLQRSSGQRSSESDRQKQSTMDTLTSALAEGPRSQRRSSENEEEESTLEKPYVKVTTVVEIGGDKLVVEKGYKKTVQSSVLETENRDEERPTGSGAASSTTRLEMRSEAASTARLEEDEPENSWNAFQKRNAGRGWSKETMRKEYEKVKPDLTGALFRLAAARERIHDHAQASAVQEEVVGPHAEEIKGPRNPWNAFQKENAGKGWSMERMRAEYYKKKAEDEKKHGSEKP